jgi:hypothetical protein
VSATVQAALLHCSPAGAGVLSITAHDPFPLTVCTTLPSDPRAVRTFFEVLPGFRSSVGCCRCTQCRCEDLSFHGKPSLKPTKPFTTYDAILTLLSACKATTLAWKVPEESPSASLTYPCSLTSR